jgi:hypothetical protein
MPRPAVRTCTQPLRPRPATSLNHILYRALARDSLHSHECIAVHPRIDERVMSACGCLSVTGKKVFDRPVKLLAQQLQIEHVKEWARRRVRIATTECSIEQLDISVVVVCNQHLAMPGFLRPSWETKAIDTSSRAVWSANSVSMNSIIRDLQRRCSAET